MQPVGHNGLGEPCYNVDEVMPGCIGRFGIDDDSVVLVLASFADRHYHVHVYLDMETGQILRQSYGGYVNTGKKETLTVLLMPEYS